MARALRSVEAAERSSEKAGGSDVPVVSVAPPKRRRPSWVLFGVILVALAALLGAYVFTAVSDRLSVMVAARDLVPGEPIDAEDLRVVEMGRTDGLRAIQPDQQDLILGQAPRGPIPEGTMLNTDLFVPEADLLPAGEVVVGVALEAGAVPTASLEAGDEVSLLAVAPPAGGTPDPDAVAEVIGEGTVWAIEGTASAESSTRVWVSLLVDEELQAPVAQAAADARLRLSLGRGS